VELVMTKQMHLAFDLSYTHMDGRWRMPGAWPGRIYPDVGAFEEIARLAERGLFDMLFPVTAPACPALGRAAAMPRCAGASAGRARI
jgi:hypothetical protein